MTMKTYLTHFALGVTFMFGMTSAGLAQTTKGSLHGTVVDPSGALIPQAQVIVSNSNGFTETLASDAEGGFAVAELEPGSYSVSISAAGFASALAGDVKVMSAKVTNEQIKLGISVNQEIDVLATDDK